MQELRVVCHSLGKQYPRILDDVKYHGSEVRPRGQLVKEVVPLDLILIRPQDCVVTRPNMNLALMEMERLQVISGVYSAKIYEAVSPGVTNLLTGHGAYGPRVQSQLLAVEEELREDPDSRRAVVYVGDKFDLNDTRKSLAPQDVPCTQSLQFLIREGRLHMLVNMRSWDIVWGLTNDVPVFVTIQMMMAAALGLRVGEYHHHAASGHIYERHFDLVASSQSRELEYTPLDGSVFMQQVDARSVVYQLDSLLYRLGKGVDVTAEVYALAAQHPTWSTAIKLFFGKARRVIAQKERVD